MEQEKQWARRIFSVLLTLTMLFVSFPAAFSFDAAAASATSGTTGDCTWKLNGTVLTISGNGMMGIYSYYSPSPWGKDITEVVIRYGVVDVGNSAFSGCTSLRSITIPYSVRSIDYAAFSGCTSLTSITIPDSVTSISYSAFSGCTSLTSITIPDSVTSIGWQAFSYCRSLTNITIPTSVTSIDSYAFSYCTGLTSITLPNSITDIASGLFLECTGLQNIVMPNTITSIGPIAFCGCKGLSSVTIPGGVITIGQRAFSLCTGLESIVIPDSVKYIYYEAFSDCSNLKRVCISDIGKWCEITFERSEASPFHKGVSLYLGSEKITEFVIPNMVTKINDYAFYGYTDLKSVTISDSVASIGHETFGDCPNLTIRTPENSAAHKYAKSEGINYYLTNVTTQPSAPTVESSQKADESSVTVTLRSVEGYEYRCDDGAWQNSPVFSGLSFGGRYRFYQRLAESTKNVAGPSSESLTVTLKSRNDTVPKAPSIASISLNTVVLEPCGGYEYSMDGKTWQSSNTFTGLTGNTNYMFYQRIAETDDAFAGISSAATEVRTSCYRIRYEANGGTGGPGTQEITSENDTVSAEIPQREGYTFCGWNMLNDPITIYHPGDIYGLTKDNTLYAMWAKNCENCHATGKVTTEIREKCNSCSGSGYQYKCSRCGRRVTLVTTGIGSYWQCSNCGVVSASRSSCIACNGRGYITDDHMDTCTVCAGSGQISEEAPVVLQYTDTKVVLREKSGCEYSADGIHFQKSAIFTGLSPATTYSFSQRKAQNGNSPFGVSGPTTKVTTDKSRPLDIPEAPTLESRTADTIVLRSISGYEYSKDGAIWYSSAKFTGLDCGTSYTFYQRVAATDTSYAGKTSASATFRTDKGTKKAPPIPIVESKTHNTVVLKPVDGCEYSKDGVTWQSSNRFTGLDPLTNYFFYQRFVESDRYYVSPSSASLSVRTEECPPYIPGDLDGDEEITEADAIYLLMASYFPDQYPLEQSCDYDGDGEITEADAIYLLMASYFPEQYPL